MNSEKISKETKVSAYSDKRHDEILGFSINTALIVDDEARKDFPSLLKQKHNDQTQGENCISIEDKRNSMNTTTDYLKKEEDLNAEPCILETANKCKSFYNGIKNRKKTRGSVWGMQME
jgi:hypothetical protein